MAKPPAGGAATTWDPAFNPSNWTLSSGNLTATITTSAWAAIRAINGRSAGSFYWEDKVIGAFHPQYWDTGLGNASVGTGDSLGDVNSVVGGSIGLDSGGAFWFRDVSGIPYAFSALTVSTGDVIGMAAVLGSGLMWFRNVTTGSNWTNVLTSTLTGTPGTPGTGGWSFSIGSPMFIVGSAAASPGAHGLNCGPTFAGAVPGGFTAWT